MFRYPDGTPAHLSAWQWPRCGCCGASVQSFWRLRGKTVPRIAAVRDQDGLFGAYWCRGCSLAFHEAATVDHEAVLLAELANPKNTDPRVKRLLHHLLYHLRRLRTVQVLEGPDPAALSTEELVQSAKKALGTRPRLARKELRRRT